MAGNHKPRVSGTDNGFWRRVHMILFPVEIPEAERDHELLAKLRNEMTGILRWAVEGCQEWRQIGLAPPPAVLAAVKEYRSDEDVVGAFLDECCTLAPGGRVDSKGLSDEFRRWADANGERRLSTKALGGNLEDRGYQRKASGGRRWILGLELRQVQDGEEAG
ncbi:MAG: phage/plasmid primase, P4 family [Anaeromyxobacteraceae bacterium]